MTSWRSDQAPPPPSGALVLADGTTFFGAGFGATGMAVGELCFNTAMTGYQEILSDPSYASQIIVFTFPHIGNTGTNDQDEEDQAGEHRKPTACGLVVRAPPGPPSNWRTQACLDVWARRRGLIGLSGVDTRALTVRIRTLGMVGASIAHRSEGNIDRNELLAAARGFAGLEHTELARAASCPASQSIGDRSSDAPGTPHAVVIDFGSKTSIVRRLADAGALVTIVPATSTIEEITACRPDGVVMSNGPGDPAATAAYAAPTIRALIAGDLPILAICLGHQILALSLGAKTVKMAQGHHGANHPVRDLDSGKVEIVSMNHGFTVDAQSLPPQMRQTHISLFDGSNCGLAIDGRRIISVQHHPEAAPGPHDATGLFRRFVDWMIAKK